MTISPPPERDPDFRSLAWQKWFARLFSSFNKFSTENDLVVDSSSKGIVLKDTSGVYWRLTISTSGAISTTNLGVNKP